MKKYIFYAWIPISFAAQSLQAQGFFVNSGATVRVSSGVNLRVKNAILNNRSSGAINNDGTIYLDSTFNQTTSATYTGGASSWLWFEGTANQSITGDATLSIARLKIDNAAGAKLSQNVTVATNLSIVQGDLNLNNKNIDLSTTGVLTEDRANNHIVVENTSGLNESTRGGYVRVSGRATTGTLTEVAGLGIHLANAGTVSIDRYHYVGTSVGNGAIKKNYAVTGTPSSATMRIEFSPDELNGLTSGSTLKLYRYSAGVWTKFGGAWANASVPYVEGTGINAFSDWTVGEEPTLPVSLIGVWGNRLNEKQVQVNWKTASEINNKGFDVEIADDNKNFSKADFVEGQINSSKIVNYRLVIHNEKGAYYRLKQIDLDGKFEYSPSVFIAGTEKAATTFNVYPNPSKGLVNIRANGDIDAQASYTVYNALGQEVVNGLLSHATVDLSQQANGIYLLKVVAGNEIFTEQIIINR